MYPNPLIYCTCCDPWNLGPRKLIKTTQPPRKVSTKKSRLDPLPPPSKDKIHVPSVATSIPTQKSAKLTALPCLPPDTQEMIYVSPGYRLFRNREQISVTLGEELFARRLPSDIVSVLCPCRSGISADLQEQISELMALIEQMNRDHQAAQNLLRKEAELRCAEMEKNFENMSRQLQETHEQQLRELEDNYKAALREEKLSSQEKIGEIAKEYKYLKNVFHVYQDSVQEEMEEKWANKKMELEQDEKLEREKILLQQKHAMAKKFALESEEEKKRLNESYCVIIENFNREKEELLKQHEMDTIQIKELKQSKKTIEKQLQTQALILESLDHTLFQTQMELKKEKAVVVNLEKTLQNKFYEAEENYKHTIQTLTEENTFLRQKIITMNEEIFEERARRLNSIPLYETNYDSLDEKNKKGESLSED
ncbi:flagellum-associated coiled-coil domain-containing protein 1 [Suncus etruscus]|uniref:flagellum-associated coiled-coil domain-containing protein 1 n=1 Tax=Suncus etruscus TaxID=109475 RepID=UPI00211067FD|nr:flagellum-associated coiled-coil domain-containing protein 1 [Suncus etruscus]